jgi:hypothetical protein
MSKILFEFEFPVGTDPAQARLAVEEALRSLDEVDQVAAEENDPRIGIVEAATVITAVVTIVRGGRELVVEMQELTRLAQAALRKIRGAAKVEAQAGGTRATVEAPGVSSDG